MFPADTLASSETLRKPARTEHPEQVKTNKCRLLRGSMAAGENILSERPEQMLTAGRASSDLFCLGRKHGQI